MVIVAVLQLQEGELVMWHFLLFIHQYRELYVECCSHMLAMHLSFQANLLSLISLDYRWPFAVLIGVVLGDTYLCFILIE